MSSVRNKLMRMDSRDTPQRRPFSFPASLPSLPGPPSPPSLPSLPDSLQQSPDLQAPPLGTSDPDNPFDVADLFAACLPEFADRVAALPNGEGGDAVTEAG